MPDLKDYDYFFKLIIRNPTLNPRKCAKTCFRFFHGRVTIYFRCVYCNANTQRISTQKILFR